MRSRRASRLPSGGPALILSSSASLMMTICCIADRRAASWTAYSESERLRDSKQNRHRVLRAAAVLL
eukprot:3011451-Heterocapsa_arctica.AAC.1